VDVAALKNAARHVRTVRRPSAQLLERGGFVSKGFQKGIRKFRRIKRSGGKVGDGLFDFNGVHGSTLGRWFVVGQVGGIFIPSMANSNGATGSAGCLNQSIEGCRSCGRRPKEAPDQLKPFCGRS
jgi:hypothetical protein